MIDTPFEDRCVITKFPLPISVNKLYKNVPGKGRAKTKDYKLYEDACRIWMLTQREQLHMARQFVRQAHGGKVIRMDMTFFFLRERILTLAGTPKRNDTSNYIKAPQDLLFEMLYADDCLIWAGSYNKRAVDNILDEGITIVMSIISP